MKAALNFVDIFGITFQLRTMKKSNFSTVFGGCLSLICVFLVAMFSIFFGNDFYNKTNPSVVFSEKIYKETNKIDLINSDFEIMFRIESQSYIFLEPETIPYSIDVSYNFLIKEGSGAQKIKFWSATSAKRCSETRAAKNSKFSDMDLTQWLCFDWETLLDVLKSKYNNRNISLLFGGLKEESESGLIRISMFNSKYDKNYTTTIGRYTNKEISDWGLKHVPGLVLRYPNAVVNGDSYENPLNKVYKQERFLLKPENYRRETREMKKINLKDDKGWIFPQNETETALKQDSISTEFFNHDMNIDNSSKGLYQAYIQLTNNETDVRRKYMKIQDLAALVGGVMKLFFSLFASIAGFYALYYRTLELLNLLYSLEEERTNLVDLVPSAEINSHTEDKINNLVKPKEGKQARASAEKGLSMGIFSYYLRYLSRQTAKVKESMKVFEAMKDYLNERFDLEFLLRHYEKFDHLVETVMTEEQKEELYARRKTNISIKSL